MTRYEEAKKNSKSIPLYMNSERNEIFGPGVHLVYQPPYTWIRIVDEIDVEEERSKILASLSASPQIPPPDLRLKRPPLYADDQNGEWVEYWFGASKESVFVPKSGASWAKKLLCRFRGHRIRFTTDSARIVCPCCLTLTPRVDK